MKLIENIIYKIFAGILIFILIPLNMHAQDFVDDAGHYRWTIGAGGGLLTGSIPTTAATNVVSDRFLVNKDFYQSFRVYAGYYLTEYESVELHFSAGSFSVFTDYEFWPDLLFENQFYAGTFSTRFRLKRVFQTLPDVIDPYGVFGLGMMQSNHKASPFTDTGTSQIDLENDKSTEYSMLFSFGAGFDIPISKNIALFFQYDYNTINTDLIGRKLAGGILRNDFIKTTSNWSTFNTGIRVRFGRSRSSLPTTERDFEPIAIQTTPTTEPIAIRQETEEVLEEEREMETIEPEREDVAEVERVQIVEPDTTADEGNDDEPELVAETTEEAKDPEPEVEGTDPEIEAIAAEEERTVEEVQTEPVAIVEEETTTELIAEPELQPRDGLFGVVNDSVQSGLTIVVHSFSLRSQAEPVLENLKRINLRAFIQQTVVNQQTFYRVAIGQFEDRAQASRAAAELPAPYPTEHFISTL